MSEESFPFRRCVAETDSGGRCSRATVVINGQRRVWCQQHWAALQRLKERERQLDGLTNEVDV